LDVNSALKDTSGRAGTGRHQNRARGFLVVSEIALAVILLVGAALMIRTFASLRAVNPGFDPHNVLTLQTSLSGGRYGTTAKVDNLIRQMTPRLESLPGEPARSAIRRDRHYAAHRGRHRPAFQHRRQAAREGRYV
jgi:hypothetical protein